MDMYRLQDGKLISNRPHLRILEPNMDYYDEVSNDALSIRGFQEYRCNDYHLGESVFQSSQSEKYMKSTV